MAMTLIYIHEDDPDEVIENAMCYPPRKATIDTAHGIRAVDRLHFDYHKTNGDVTVSVYLSRRSKH